MRNRRKGRNDMKGNPECRYCVGRGWYWVQNGPDDVEKEPCETCIDYEYEKEEMKNGKHTTVVSK